MDELLHWVIAESDEHTACGLPADSRFRASNMEVDGGHPACTDCERLWMRHSVKQAA
jgi:hypothetical protein